MEQRKPWKSKTQQRADKIRWKLNLPRCSFLSNTWVIKNYD